MFNRFWRTACIAGLLLTSGAWFGTYGLAASRGPQETCFTLGYSRLDAWLVNAVIYPDGFVLVRRFSPNPSYRDGAYAKTSDANESHAVSLHAFLPSWLSRPPRGVSGFLFHLALPITLFFALTAQAVAYPIWRGRRRRKRGLCIGCGYNMRGATSKTCTECGRNNDHIVDSHEEIATKPVGNKPVS